LERPPAKSCPQHRIKITAREYRILELLLEGCENPEIAKRLGIAPRTVKAYFNHLFHKWKIEDGGVKRVKLAVAIFRAKQKELRGKTDSAA
jgi:DNA-binding NarL/FixJ family response regulator